jgi:hypothetical protein
MLLPNIHNTYVLHYLQYFCCILNFAEFEFCIQNVFPVFWVVFIVLCASNMYGVGNTRSSQNLDAARYTFWN